MTISWRTYIAVVGSAVGACLGMICAALRFPPAPTFFLLAVVGIALGYSFVGRIR